MSLIKNGENLVEKDLFSSRINGVADKVFIERWSPRSFVSDTIPELDLKKIIDAARWSPSTVMNSRGFSLLLPRGIKISRIR